jgi:hypothetical protein
MPRFAPAPYVRPETWVALLEAANTFARLKPWENVYDTDVVGLIDPASGETRLGSVLGNAEEVFAAVFYRRPSGLRWILQMMDESCDPNDLNNVEGMDALKLEFVPKHELSKDDKLLLKTAGFKPTGKGCVWPQFRSSEPGWHPWHINQAEAEQILADLPRLTAFCALIEEHGDIFENRAPNDIPFLPVALPERRLRLSDLDWRPLLPPPIEQPAPFEPAAKDLTQLMALPQNGQSAFEFDCTILPGMSLIEQGRPCFGRISLLVETQRGLVLGVEVQSSTIPRGNAAGSSLVKSLLTAGHRPRELHIYPSALEESLEPLCNTLDIRLLTMPSLPALETAIESLARSMPF